ncbi:hypothetical protein A2U01_0052979, partial [Trifolium medium]|nr:hypothetical protein [Trifolium medium]
ESKPPKGKFTGYTPLKALRERIVAEVAAADFKKAGIHFPNQLPAKATADKSKYCRYHRSHGHMTEDCVHLKDAIEILIQKGYARKYVKEGEQVQHREPRETPMVVDAPEEDDQATIPAVYAISRVEIPLSSPGSDEEALMRHFNAHMNGSWE